ncbi:MAG: serine/threonine protein kinase [Oligoflexia bacterium]|nr:serine/threonine protein kinase [Oligoflexia bacterium]
MSFKPEVFGKYILLDKIAMGGMAEVYRAKAPGAEGIGKIIAIKRILPQYSANSEFIQMFKSEAKIAINLANSSIAQIFEFGEEEGTFYLAMEFIDGRNLRQVLSRCAKLQKALTIEQCVFLMGQVANALDYAHRCTDKNSGTPLNIIHRDMSPQNIMLSFEGEVKIVDFGIAKAESKIESTRAGTLKGKFGYMSPEQCEGMELDARTDIFSTGIVLWELLSGERLFVANNEVNTIRKIRECKIPSLRKINPNIHEELERITNKALARDRSLRYQTSAELYRDLSRFLYKVNPEFTQHELGLILKTLFKDEIVEDRKKVQDFAKISFQALPKEERTVLVNDGTKTFTATSLSDINHVLGKKEVDLPKNLLSEEAMNAKNIDLNIKVDRIEMAKKVISSQTPKQQSSFTRTTGVNPLGTNTSITSLGRGSGLGRFVPLMFVFVGLALGAQYVVNNKEKFFGSNRQVASPQADNTQATKPSTPTLPKEFNLFIRSVPNGASIEIDGQPSGETPREVKVPAGKPFRIGLKRQGFIPYYKDYQIDKAGQEFAATLQKAAVGYLNIEVSPSHNVDIYVNGQKLVEKSPIRRYAVPAGTVIQVRALNPYNDASDQKTLSLKQDTEQTVRLFLRRK